jgi:hypothetical protein
MVTTLSNEESDTDDDDDSQNNYAYHSPIPRLQQHRGRFYRSPAPSTQLSSINKHLKEKELKKDLAQDRIA